MAELLSARTSLHNSAKRARRVSPGMTSSEWLRVR